MRAGLQMLIRLSLVGALFPGFCRGEERTMPEIELPKTVKHPFIACTAEELARLQAAYKETGPLRDVIANYAVTKANRATSQPIEFPPRGGQHNQWYQCDACQIALKTIDDTHHQCPKCRKVHTGEPYDDVIFARKHEANLSNMLSAGWAYAITGKREYAQFAAKVLLGYAERYRSYPYHSNDRKGGATTSRSGGHLFEQTLNEAAAMAGKIAPAYDLIHDSGVLSPQDHDSIRTGLLAPMLRNIEKNHAGMSNWQTWHNAAFIWGGAMVQDANWIRQAVEDPKNGFAFQMKASITSDGMWYENSWGYHFYTLSAMVAIAEGARRIGIDLYTHPSLKKMFTLPIRYTMADGSLPRFGDDVNTSVSSAAYMLEYACNAYKDASLGDLLPVSPNWQSIMFGRKVEQHPRVQVQGSEVFRGAGHAILRTKGEAGLSAAMTFGPYGGFHGHFDKLTFVFFGHGKELGVDPGRAASQAYRLPIHTNWYKPTIGHNGVLVDAATQKPAEGKLESFACCDTHAAVVASCEAAYPGVKHRRMLCMTPTYLLVFDDLAADKDRRFDWLYHNRGASFRCPAADKDGKLGESYAGQEYVSNIKVGRTDDPIRVEFAGDDVTTHLTAAAGAKTEVRIGDGVGASVMDRVPLAMITRYGQTAQFAVVLEPVAKGGKPAVSGLQVEQTPDGIRITVQNGAQKDTVLLGADGKLTVSSGQKVVLTNK